MDLASRDLKKRSIKTILALVVGSLILSTVVLLAILTSGFSIYAISGTSMVPTLHDKNTVILEEEDTLQHEQIAFIKPPRSWFKDNSAESLIVKRVIAVPGDTLEFDGDSFIVNGDSVFDLSSVNYNCLRGEKGYHHTLSSHEVFVMGDNSNASLDSRWIFCSGRADESYVVYEDLLDYGKIVAKF